MMFVIHCRCAPLYPEENRLEESHLVEFGAWMGKLFYRDGSHTEESLWKGLCFQEQRQHIIHSPCTLPTAPSKLTATL